MDIVNYIIEKALVLVPVLLIIGKIVKEIPNIKNWLIPFILLPFGIVGAMLIMGFNVDAVIQGVLVTGMAVYGNQVYKQLSNKGDSGESDESES